MKKATRTATTKQPKGAPDLVEEERIVAEESKLDVMELPVLPVRNTVLMPNIVVPLMVGQDNSMKAIDKAMSKGRSVFVVTQLDENTEDPGPEDVYTFEAGVRNLEREIAAVMRKVARKVAEGRRAKAKVTAEKIPDYLGPQKQFYGQAEEEDEVGVATGVAWTSAGGDLTTVEATLMDGRGNLTLTGQLGDVMKESAQAALSYARSRASQFGLEPRFYEKYDIHLHLPAGGIPKDGPSAGITMAVALISALTKRATRRDVAMTGEITLRGRVLPIGGVKEKVLAAHRAGIKTFILPKRNMKDLEDVPRDILREMRFVPVERMDSVIAVALHEAPLLVDVDGMRHGDVVDKPVHRKTGSRPLVRNATLPPMRDRIRVGGASTNEL